MDDVLGLNEVEAVVQRGSCKLHAHLIRDLVQRNQIRSILVLNGHTESNVLHTHLTQFLQRAVTALVAVLQTTDLVIGLLQTFDRDTDTDLRELLAQINDTVGEETVRGNNDTVGLLVQFTQIGIRISIEGLEQTNNEIRGLQNGYQRGYGTDVYKRQDLQCPCSDKKDCPVRAG